MKKIMFNDRYGLTKAVLEGRKTATRRLCNFKVPDDEIEKILDHSPEYIISKAPYKVGEIVAVGQRYSTLKSTGDGRRSIVHPNCAVNGTTAFCSKGWNNKMFVRADLMPHQIRITSVRAERLRDISEEDCMKEGVCGEGFGFFVPGIKCRDWSKESHVDTEDGMTWKLFPTRRQAFSALIDKINGKGTLDSNPWVWVYEFELIK